jgi:hypothetical protein
LRRERLDPKCIVRQRRDRLRLQLIQQLVDEERVPGRRLVARLKKALVGVLPNGQQDISAIEQNGQGYRINGPTPAAHFGASVADAGDIDGDGIPDIITGAPNYNNGAGEAIVSYGLNASNGHDVNTGNVTIASGYALQSPGNGAVYVLGF